MKIHISFATAEHLDRAVYDIEERGSIDVKVRLLSFDFLVGCSQDAITCDVL